MTTDPSTAYLRSTLRAIRSVSRNASPIDPDTLDGFLDQFNRSGVQVHLIVQPEFLDRDTGPEHVRVGINRWLGAGRLIVEVSAAVEREVRIKLFQVLGAGFLIGDDVPLDRVLLAVRLALADLPDVVIEEIQPIVDRAQRIAS